MRWINPPEPAKGDTRIITRFLWLPLELAGETRWLERASIRERFRVVNLVHVGGPRLAWWEPEAFIN